MTTMEGTIVVATTKEEKKKGEYKDEDECDNERLSRRKNQIFKNDKVKRRSTKKRVMHPKGKIIFCEKVH